MAIAFNLPSEREASEENFSRLNRLLAELYDVLCHILVARQPGADGQPGQDARRERPYSSESDVPGLPVPDLQRRRSASSPPLALTLDDDLDDDVFVPRNAGNDIFSTRNLEIIGCNTARSPAGVPLSPRRDRAFHFSLAEKHCRDKGGTDVADGLDADVIDAATPVTGDSTSSEGSIFSSIIPDKVSGSICGAVLIMLGWRLFVNKR